MKICAVPLLLAFNYFCYPFYILQEKKMFLACLRHNLFSLKTVYCSLLRSVDIYYAVKTFLEYAEDVAHLIEGLQYHLFADDMMAKSTEGQLMSQQSSQL